MTTASRLGDAAATLSWVGLGVIGWARINRVRHQLGADTWCA